LRMKTVLQKFWTVLGIEVNEELVQEVARKGHKWKNPIWRNYDGTVAEW